MKKSILFAIVGFIIGVPISYWFQPGLVRSKLSLGDYIKEIPSFFENIGSSGGVVSYSDLAGNVVISCLIFTVFLGIIGYQLDRRNDGIKV